MNIFDQKGIVPMQLHRVSQSFSSPDYLYELKISGLRCIAYLTDHSTDLRDSKNHSLLPLIPELRNLHQTVKQPCILDGVLIVLKDGIPNLHALKYRLKITDPAKQIHYPISYVAFDLLYVKDKLVTQLPLLKRKLLLEEIVQETIDLTLSRYIENSANELLQIARNEKLEGVIAKRKESRYHIGENSKDWIQLYPYPFGHYILCGYLLFPSGKNYFLFGQYDGDRLLYRGKLPSSECLTDALLINSLQDKHLQFMEESPFMFTPILHAKQQVLWLFPSLVCRIAFPSTKSTTFKNASFICACKDYLAKDCRKDSSFL